MSKIKAGFFNDINVGFNTAFNVGYTELPDMLNMLYVDYKVNKKLTKFPVSNYNRKLKEFKGQRVYDDPSKAFEMEMTYKKWSEQLDVDFDDYYEAQQIEDITKLNLYRNEAEGMGKEIADFPLERSIVMIANGTTNKYGTCFDKQPLFATTHDFNDQAGTQSNLISGSGVTLANFETDLRKALQRFVEFTRELGGEGDSSIQKRSLNKVVKPVVMIPATLFSVAEQLRTKSLINNTENELKGTFEIRVIHFSDNNDWYIINNSGGKDSIIIGNTVGLKPGLKAPGENDPRYVENHLLTWRSDIFYQGFGYGAWYKIIKVTNS